LLLRRNPAWRVSSVEVAVTKMALTSNTFHKLNMKSMTFCLNKNPWFTM
jgi:hypothetical protein